jgi:hypothetical protein
MIKTYQIRKLFRKYNTGIPVLYTLKWKFIYVNEIFGLDKYIILATQENLAHLENTDTWFGDWTFFVCPHGFFQLYTIFGIIKTTPFPFFYCLMYSTSTTLYNEVFKT